MPYAHDKIILLRETCRTYNGWKLLHDNLYVLKILYRVSQKKRARKTTDKFGAV